MLQKDAYQDSLWLKIQRLPYLIAIGMEGASKSGVAGSAGERHAMVDSFVDGRRSYPGNPIIRSIIPSASDEYEHRLELARRHDEILDCLGEKDFKKYEDIKQYIFKILAQVIEALQTGETTQTVREYKDWLLLIAENVAHAGKEGDFMGIGGKRYSEQENEFFQELKDRLYPVPN